MPEQENQVELKFRLYDGSDIGPIRCASSSTVAMLKERVISEWPRDKKIIPRVATDVRLICGGEILENSKTVLSADHLLEKFLLGLSPCMLSSNHPRVKLKQVSIPGILTEPSTTLTERSDAA